MSREDFEPLVWARKGFSRIEAERWWQNGFALGEAQRWCQRFDADEAAAWRAAGVTSPREARAWRVAAVGASEVAAWRAAGIGFAEAATWHEFEYTLEQAKKLKAEGRSPSEEFRRRVQQLPSQPSPTGRSAGFFGRAAGPGTSTFVERVAPRYPRIVSGYFIRQWVDDEAISWAERGIEAADAQAWKELGLAPAEAARLVEAGATPVATMRAWWEAGIPFAEVAAWVGAGLTAEEAAAQRAKGITAERAAVMRALRDADGGDAAAS